MAKPAFRLRKATTDDFPIFYNFHIHFCYNWLFLDELATKEDDPFNITFEDTVICSKECIQHAHQHIINFNIEDLEKHLKWFKVFMIIVDDKVVGYVELENYCNQFIVREWRMHYEYMDIKLLDALLEKFETYAPKKSNVIQVISMGNLAKDFLKSHGYTAKVEPFFQKTV